MPRATALSGTSAWLARSTHIVGKRLASVAWPLPRTLTEADLLFSGHPPRDRVTTTAVAVGSKFKESVRRLVREGGTSRDRTRGCAWLAPSGGLRLFADRWLGPGLIRKVGGEGVREGPGLRNAGGDGVREPPSGLLVPSGDDASTGGSTASSRWIAGDTSPRTSTRAAWISSRENWGSNVCTRTTESASPENAEVEASLELMRSPTLAGGFETVAGTLETAAGGRGTAAAAAGAGGACACVAGDKAADPGGGMLGRHARAACETESKGGAANRSRVDVHATGSNAARLTLRTLPAFCLPPAPTWGRPLSTSRRDRGPACRGGIVRGTAVDGDGPRRWKSGAPPARNCS